MTTTQLVIVCATVLIVVVIAFGRKLTVTFHDVKATVERTETHVADVKSTVGESNGGGDVIHQLDELRRELADQTSVTRAGATEPEELRSYIQDRMHKILGRLAAQDMKVNLLWDMARAHGFDLPELPPPPNLEEP